MVAQPNALAICFLKSLLISDVQFLTLNPNWHKLRKQEKCSSLWQGVKLFWYNTGYNVNFYLQKSLEIFDTNSADKIQPQNYKGGKSSLSHAN